MRRADPQRQRRSRALCRVRLAVVADGVAIFPGPSPAFWPRSTGRRRNRPDVSLVLSARADCPFLPRDLVARLHRR
jgi:molybdopterin-guanine dinucleotide biosynthesis protein A